MIFPHRITILNAPLIAGDYNNQERDWENAAPTTLEGFWQPSLSVGGDSEDTAGADIQTTNGLVFFAVGAPVTGSSRITVAHVPNRIFEVVGPPDVNITGRATDHIRAVVRNIEG